MLELVRYKGHIRVEEVGKRLDDGVINTRKCDRIDLEERVRRDSF
jgi:hypothetical protein